MEKKIELLCLHDVEYRILYYMAELARTFGAKANGSEYSIPLSQGELASLIGATRETTSTTLNTLARRGVIKLGRRQLIVPSVDGVLAAANQRSPGRQSLLERRTVRIATMKSSPVSAHLCRRVTRELGRVIMFARTSIWTPDCHFEARMKTSAFGPDRSSRCCRSPVDPRADTAADVERATDLNVNSRYTVESIDFMDQRALPAQPLRAG